LKEKILHYGKSSYKDLLVVNDVSFSVDKGEMIGLIGRNGSGKSTLLKLLSRIIYPDKGQIKMNGRVSSLLELGAGFHPDFTGIENIYMNASIFGLSKKEINKKINKIIEFSDLNEFVHNPVRTYSSGMYMRLAFATAINVEPDILLVDEVLAVGDASFQRKCLNRIIELKNSGKSIVLVTHDHGVVERLCDRAIWLDQGRMMSIGKPKDVVNDYLSYLAERDEKKLQEVESATPNNLFEEETESVKEQSHDSNRWGTREIEVVNVNILIDNQSQTLIQSNGRCIIEINYIIRRRPKTPPIFGIAIHTLDKIRVYGTNTHIDEIDTSKLPDQGKIIFEIPSLNLVEGDYVIDVGVHDINGLMYDYLASVSKLRVISTEHDVGIAKIPHKWRLE
jgi:ABC-type polysaccharide/polyol phosphate transport system ATPase subunit